MNPVSSAAAISEAFRVYGRHASVVVGTSILLQVLGVAASFVMIAQFGELGFLLSTFVSSIVGAMTMGVATVLLLHLRAGSEVPTITGLVSATLPRLLPLIGLSIVMYIGVGVGFLLIIAPGIIIALRSSVAAPAMIAGRLGISDSLRSSWHLTGGHLGSTFVMLLFQGLIAVGLPFLAVRIAGDAPVAENLILAQAFAAALILPIPALASADFFLRLSGYPPIAGSGVAAASAIEVERALSDGSHSQPWVPQAPAYTVPGATYPPAPAQPGGAAAYPKGGAMPPAQPGPFTPQQAPTHPGAFTPQPAPTHQSAPFSRPAPGTGQPGEAVRPGQPHAPYEQAARSGAAPTEPARAGGSVPPPSFGG